MLCDTHFHLDEQDNEKDIISRAKESNVNLLIMSGCDKKGIPNTLRVINDYNNVYGTIGYHPSEADIVTKSDLEELEQLISSNNKIIGLGEIGLDYYYGKENKERQIHLFEEQLKIASKLNIPVVIHSRDAFQDTYETLRKYKLKGIIHCFSGSIEVANKYIELGYYIGIGGVITFKNSKLADVVSKIPIKNIVLETDSPYLAPVPHRGEKNEPRFIPIIVDKISECTKISPKDVENITYNNVCRLFDLEK